MKISATYTLFQQVDYENYRNISKTKIFDDTSTFNDLEKFARTVSNGKSGWQELILGIIVEEKSLTVGNH